MHSFQPPAAESEKTADKPAHSSLLIVAAVSVLLAAVLVSYKVLSGEKKMRLDKSAQTQEQFQRDAQAAADYLAERQRTADSAAVAQSTEPVQSRISVIPDANFVGIAPGDKNPMQLLQQMAGGPGGEDNSDAAVTLGEGDLGAVVYPQQYAGPDLSVSSSTLSDIDQKTRNAPLYAPVSKLVMSEQKALDEFRRLHPDANLPKTVDFASRRLVVLISVSRLPNKVFEALGADCSGPDCVVRFRVNPAAALEGGADRFTFALADSSAKPVRLEQLN